MREVGPHDIAGNQKVLGLPRLSDVDPARFALASSGTNTDMLLYTPQARVHGFIITEKAPFEDLSVVPDLVRGIRTYQCLTQL
ncbi:MAG: hypothetical protein A3D46_00255 [Candidatus Nealsonbacteria bacterium RIFCSPHIGHO2_02_FULL_43_13]|uniref:Uncharacterized protein n=1 Tax=Candidatus Nealsonbacteria bacterium RIFCSPHIGHO2_02_FULL_43_13 TaxID=1801668 RepID=A0A1G2E621_9BACT|nr:MAG: hypothetical protein A3D46_00255 [Candidatus Nealsonbacteria bacterium RIFCSPHIGHO2_02_FULL_43_13]